MVNEGSYGLGGSKTMMLPTSRLVIEADFTKTRSPLASIGNILFDLTTITGDNVPVKRISKE